MWDLQYSMEFPPTFIPREIYEIIMWNIVSPTKQRYESKYCCERKLHIQYIMDHCIKLYRHVGR